MSLTGRAGHKKTASEDAVSYFYFPACLNKDKPENDNTGITCASEWLHWPLYSCCG